MRGLFLEGNDVGYSQDFHYHRGVPAGVYEVTETANGWKLTAPGYGDKAAYGNGALRLSKESNPVFPGTLFFDVQFGVTFVPDTTSPAPDVPWKVRKACQHGHVFYWTSSSTGGQPDPGLRCECGLVKYSDVITGF